VALPIGDLSVRYDAGKESGVWVQPPLPVFITSRAWLCSLVTSRWIECVVIQNRGPIHIEKIAGDIVGGMSGTPIVTDRGFAIGIVCRSGRAGEGEHDSHMNPRLAGNLPGWLLRELGVLARWTTARGEQLTPRR
jgi:hypothetical protein